MNFFDNTVVLNHDFAFRADRSLRLGGLSLRDLRRTHRHVAEEFDNASLDIMSVYAEDERDVNELFVRLNKSKPLTGAEVRNAIAGPVTDVIRRLTEHVIFQESIKFSTLRAGDQNAAAKCLLFEYEGRLVNTKKANLDDFAKGQQSDRRVIDKNRLELAARRTLDTFDSMEEVFIPNDTLLSSAGTFPVYYWLVRNVAPIYLEDVRSFLLEFEETRRIQREAQKELGPNVEIDQQYSRYDTLNRSTNDAVSHRERYAILRLAFNEYCQEHYNVEQYGPIFVSSNRDESESA